MNFFPKKNIAFTLKKPMLPFLYYILLFYILFFIYNILQYAILYRPPPLSLSLSIFSRCLLHLLPVKLLEGAQC